MRYQAFVRAAAAVLSTALFAAGAPYAQDNTNKPDPVVMSDMAPLPAHDRSSVGAVILMDEPVLAQREALLQAQERTGVDTRTMGAGPARVLREVFTKEQLEQQRAIEAEERMRETPK